MEQERKRPGRPRIHGRRSEFHVKMPEDDLAYLMKNARNVNAWIVRAIQKEMAREKGNTTMTQYVEKYELETRGPVDPGQPEEVEGLLVVGTRVALEFYSEGDQFGNDFVQISPAIYNGNRCWLRREVWCPAAGYSASGTQEEIISFEDGVKLFLERGVFEFSYH